MSNIRVVPRASVSRTPPPFTMIPRFAEREIPATIAIGTASRSGHGVATTRTESARIASPLTAHAAPASSRVTGTKISAYRSASRTDGAFAATRLPHQPDDARVRAVGGDRRRVQVERGAGVHGARTDEVAVGSFHRSRFAGERRFVEDPVRLEQAVDRHHLACLHEQPVAQAHVFDRDVDQRAVVVAMGLIAAHVRSKPRQLAMGPPVGVGLQRLPGGKHERDHRAREVLLERERADDRQSGDHVHAELSPCRTTERRRSAAAPRRSRW